MKTNPSSDKVEAHFGQHLDKDEEGRGRNLKLSGDAAGHDIVGGDEVKHVALGIGAVMKNS